ncbi:MULTISPECIES: MotA/TolQ/ExbB proton channel family protein [unclassified Yoonia]|uniref:MotA/TolQ/ExbB proton channel family protein n=1 Tax=unclassified Yoonia TaxID=2629118 RepID=UPI002AFE4E44|nr:MULTISPECIES: MotA/TolQ/ExbB proton channel family protein [unclassified Yoonia]
MTFFAQMTAQVQALMALGGIAIVVIAALSVVTLGIILWKVYSLLRLGAWAGGRTRRAVALWQAGEIAQAFAQIAPSHSLRAQVAQAAMHGCRDRQDDEAAAREETARVARAALEQARSGLRSLELIATIAPLLGLLGTVLGMIGAFQALQQTGVRADPAALAGGIWEALLTTAAGMAVAIPASVALTWFESVNDRLRFDMEDAATRIFLARPAADQPLAA